MKLPRIITHKHMKPLIEAVASAPEFQPGCVAPRNPDAWYRRQVTLEFPLGEMCMDGMTTLALVGTAQPKLAPARKDDKFVAHGIEPKVRVTKPLYEALYNMRDLLPEHRGRIITRGPRERPIEVRLKVSAE